MVHRRKTTRGCNTKGGRRRRTNRKTLKRGVKIGGNDLRNQSPYIKDRGIKELNELVPMTNDEIMATPYGCIVYLFNCNPNGDILRENTDKNYCYVRSDKESRTASILLQEYVISTGKKFSEYDVSYEIRYINGEFISILIKY